MNLFSVLLISIIFIPSISLAQKNPKDTTVQNKNAIAFTVNWDGATDAWDDPDTPADESIDGICQDENGHCTITAAIQEAQNIEAETGIPTPAQINIAGDFFLGDHILLAPTTGSTISGGKIRFGIDGNIIIDEGGINGCTIEMKFGGLSLRNAMLIDSKITFEPLFGAAGGSLTLAEGSIADNNALKNCAVSLEDDSNMITHCTVSFINSAGGVSVPSKNNTVQDNTIVGSTSAGLIVAGTSNKILNNKIGVEPPADIPDGGNGTGIIISGGGMDAGDHNLIENNVISGNHGIGISVAQSETNNLLANIIRANKIGTNSGGTSAVGNAGTGIDITGASYNLIEHNIIAGNGGNGIVLSSSDLLQPATNNIIKNNFIGVSESESPIPNLGNGIAIIGNAGNNIIGSTLGTDVDTNVIAHNALAGIVVQTIPPIAPQNNIFRRNRMYGNSEPGILLQPTTQDGIERPVIDSIQILPSTNDVVVHGKSKAQSRIDVYSVSDNTFQYGEGKNWLGKGDADPLGKFAVNVGPLQLQCDKLTVLQTDQQNNTSAYAMNKGVLPTIFKLTEKCAPSLFGGIAYADNKYTVHIDWKNLPKEGTIRFFLNGIEKPGTISGDIADVEYNMSQTVVGTNTLTWELRSCDGQIASGLNRIEFCGNPVPEWLNPVTAMCSSGHMKYTHMETFPDVPGIAAGLDIPPSIAFVGGLILKFADAPEFSTTLNIPGESTPISANTSFKIGDFGTSISVNGTASTTFAGCNDVDLSGTITLTAGVSKDYSYGFSFGSIPSPPVPGMQQVVDVANAISNSLRVGATLSGEITGTATLSEGIEITGGSGGATLALSPFLDVATFHARGTGQVVFNFAVPSFSVTSVDASVTVTISESISGLSRTWIYPSAFPSAQEESIRPESKNNYFTSVPYKPFTGKSVGTDTTLEHAVAWNAKPAFAVGPNDTKAFAWVSYRMNGENKVSDIALKYFDGAQWKQTIALTNDDHVDRNPAIVFDNTGNIVIGWEKNSSLQAIPESLQYSSAVMKNFNIMYSVHSPANGTLIGSGMLGTADTYDALPKFAKGKDGSMMLSWQVGSGENLYGTDAAPVRLVVAHQWNGSQWNSFDTIPAAQSKMFQWDFAVNDGQNAMIAVVKDTKDELSSGNDWEIFTIRKSNGIWSSAQQLTANVIMEYGVNAAYTHDGTPVVTWMRDTSIIGSYGAVAASQEIWIPNAGMGFFNNSFAVGKDTMVLMWNEGTSAVLSMSSVTQRAWSVPKFAHFTTDIQRSLSTQFGTNGSLHIGYQQSPYNTHPGQFSDSGSLQLISIEKVSSPLGLASPRMQSPVQFTLFDAFPNPFNSSATIRFILPKRAYTILTVTNILGREVARLADGELNEGEHSVYCNAERLASGIYFYTLRSGGVMQTKKMIMIK